MMLGDVSLGETAKFIVMTMVSKLWYANSQSPPPRMLQSSMQLYIQCLKLCIVLFLYVLLVFDPRSLRILSNSLPKMVSSVSELKLSSAKGFQSDMSADSGLCRFGLQHTPPHSFDLLYTTCQA